MSIFVHSSNLHSDLHCTTVCIPNFSSPYFPEVGLNTERYSECGKIQTRKTPNTYTYNAVLNIWQSSENAWPRQHYVETSSQLLLIWTGSNKLCGGFFPIVKHLHVNVKQFSSISRNITNCFTRENQKLIYLSDVSENIWNLY